VLAYFSNALAYFSNVFSVGYFSRFRWKVIVCFVNIGGTVDHHCLNFLFIILYVLKNGLAADDLRPYQNRLQMYISIRQTLITIIHYQLISHVL
jgi:hypothetical protein